MNSKKVLVCGLPESGKSTYIAAFWYYVCNASSVNSLEVGSLSEGDTSYLNELSGRWLECDVIIRNISGPHSKPITINLKRKDNNNPVVLDIPDFNGETFDVQFENREWTLEFGQMVNTMDGVLLFIDPTDSKNTPQLIFRANEYIRIFGEGQEHEQVQQPTESWNLKKHVPNQVKLVDLLQFMEDHFGGRRKIKICIVVSKWDMVAKSFGENMEPKLWMELQLPLVYQYLCSNQEIFSVQIFGVSAQGGDYSEDKDKLQSINPMERIKVKKDSQISNNITEPILWLTE
jgi:hypothetical protein